jgi:2-hydroxy-4-(methylsulfanyl)butanoate S-methyltransferase
LTQFAFTASTIATRRPPCLAQEGTAVRPDFVPAAGITLTVSAIQGWTSLRSSLMIGWRDFRPRPWWAAVTAIVNTPGAWVDEEARRQLLAWLSMISFSRLVFLIDTALYNSQWAAMIKWGGEAHVARSLPQPAEDEFKVILPHDPRLFLNRVIELANSARPTYPLKALIGWRCTMKLETTNDVQVFMNSHFAAAVLTAALERKLFWKFDDRPQTIERMADLLEIPLEVCRNWLRFLSSLGLLEEAEGGYRLSAAAQTAIMESHDMHIWSELAREERTRWAGDMALVGQLFESGSIDRSKKEVLGPEPDYVQAMRNDPQQAYRFTHMLYGLHRPLAEDIARQLDLAGARQLLDVGGGSGVVSLALLRKNPELTATVIDIPNVCAAGRQIADSTPESNRITYYPADYYVDEFPGRFDVILACDIIGYDQPLVDKVAAQLEEGGRFIIVDRWFEEPREWTVGQSAYLLRRSLKDSEFSLPSIAEIYERLRAAGLEPIAREEIPYGKWQMIQARQVG